MRVAGVCAPEKASDGGGDADGDGVNDDGS